MKFKSLALLAFTSLLIMTGCNSTEIIGSYMAPEADEKSYNSVLVTGLSRNILPREMIEQEMVDALKKENVYASHSMNVISENMDMSEESVQDSVLMAVEAKGFDAYLTVTLLDKETEAHYVPGNIYEPVVGYPYYGNFWGYYTYSYGVVYDPGYYTLEKYYYIEANLYDAESEKLIWSAQTRSHDPGSIENLADDFAKVIAEELDEQEILMQEN